MMDLKVSEKILIDFNNLLNLEELPSQMEVIPHDPGVTYDPIIKDYNPSLIICSETSQEIVSNSEQIQLPAQKIIPRDNKNKNQICFLKTLIPGNTDVILSSPSISSSHSETFISNPLDKLVPRTNWWPNLQDTSTDFTSHTGGNIVNILQEEEFNSISSNEMVDENILLQTEQTPPLSPDLHISLQPQQPPVTPPSSRPTRRTRQIISQESNTLTSIKLPSGKTLLFSTQNEPTASMHDATKQ